MDEIFGEENFVGSIIRQSKVGGGSDSKHLVKEHEYLLVFAKKIDSLPEMFIQHNTEYLKRYKESDSTGRFFWDTYARPGLATGTDDSLIYEIKMPDGTFLKNRWRRSKDRFIEDLQNDIVRLLRKNDGSWSVQFKQYLNDEGKKPRSLTSDIGDNNEGRGDFVDVMKNAKIFDYPKPVRLIKFLANIICDSNAIILDFFAGSGTTAQAITELNSEDGGARKWICVQIPEEISENTEAKKNGFNTIADLSRARIKLATYLLEKVDIGFKSFTLEKSNYRQWNILTEFDDKEKFKKQTKLFLEKPLIDDYDPKSVVNEILCKEGLNLNDRVEQVYIHKMNIWKLTNSDRNIFISFDSKITKDQIDELNLSENSVFICFDSAIDDGTRVNLGRKIKIKTI
jgi:adenine-specific DNA-methyltransferase